MSVLLLIQFFFIISVLNSIYHVSVICKLAMKWYLVRMCAS